MTNEEQAELEAVALADLIMAQMPPGTKPLEALPRVLSAGLILVQRAFPEEHLIQQNRKYADVLRKTAKKLIPG